jgi:opacity protein-like surface antigen
MRFRRALVVLTLAAAALAVPSQARADWFFTPFIGANFSGDAVDTNVNFGGSLGYMGGGVVGFEVDFGYSPNFWEDPGTSVDGDVTSLMANVIVGVPIGGQGQGVRPYVSGGAGLLRSAIDDVDDFFDVTDNSFGFNVGGGAMVFLTDHVGFRGDVRYFRSLEDEDGGDDLDIGPGDFDFWRGTFGVAIRF